MSRSSWPERVRKISAKGNLAQVPVLGAVLTIRQAHGVAGLVSVLQGITVQSRDLVIQQLVEGVVGFKGDEESEEPFLVRLRYNEPG